jgi:hypothetical protein
MRGDIYLLFQLTGLDGNTIRFIFVVENIFGFELGLKVLKQIAE